MLFLLLSEILLYNYIKPTKGMISMTDDVKWGLSREEINEESGNRILYMVDSIH